jgi:hypothetical protein
MLEEARAQQVVCVRGETAALPRHASHRCRSRPWTPAVAGRFASRAESVTVGARTEAVRNHEIPH